MQDEGVVAGLHCGEVLADLTDYIEGWLGQDRSARITEHLRGCEGCRRLLNDLTSLVRVLRQMPEEPLDSGVAARLYAHFHPEDTAPLG